MTRACLPCARPFEPQSVQHRYCSVSCRARAGRATERQLYDRRHKNLRRQLRPLVAAGLATCAKCGQQILPGEP
jgi:hypothetical protein